MNRDAQGAILLAALRLQDAVDWLELARKDDAETRIAIDHIVDEQKLLRLAEKLREIANEPAKDRRIFTEGKIS